MNEPLNLYFEQNSDMDKTTRTRWSKILTQWRILEFSCSFTLLVVGVIFALIKVNERVIPNIEVQISANHTFWARDPTINQKKLKEQVPMWLLISIGTGIPILTNLFINYLLPKCKVVTTIPNDTRDFLLSMAQSVGLSQLITQFLKNMTGRFRPCFYDMCKWNKTIVWNGLDNLCADLKWEKEARKSFPSGHASFAWATLFLLTLYLLGRSRLNSDNRHEGLTRGGRKTFKMFVCFLPTLLAAWIAVTRSMDNWHHYSDILAGSIIGGFAACFGYFYNYGSIFSSIGAGLPQEQVHFNRKKKEHDFLEASMLQMMSQVRPTEDNEVVEVSIK